MITIANTRQFGNNAFIAPNAKPNDGKMDLVLVKAFPFYLYPYFVLHLFFRRLKKSKHIEYIQTDKSFTLKTDIQEFHLDGEPILLKDDIHITLERKALKIIKTRFNKLSDSFC